MNQGFDEKSAVEGVAVSKEVAIVINIRPQHTWINIVYYYIFKLLVIVFIKTRGDVQQVRNPFVINYTYQRILKEKTQLLANCLVNVIVRSILKHLIVKYYCESTVFASCDLKQRQ